MIPLIYVEAEVMEHPRTQAILARHPRATLVPIERYGEIFNSKQQHFALQKSRPALILARKHANFVQPAPSAYGVGGDANFYFSHMLNCLYDCRYCFLQGMYRSAHYVVFVNYEDFFAAIDQHRDPQRAHWFFSGYDADSLVLEPVTAFVEAALPFFATRPDAWLELRTKSTQVSHLLTQPPLHNVVTAFSFTPEPVWQATEHRVPSIAKRLEAMRALVAHGWPVALRLDPLIYQPTFAADYATLLEQIFQAVTPAAMHSVTLGPFRMPKGFHRTLQNLYPTEALFVAHLHERDAMVSYAPEVEADMVGEVTRLLEDYLPQARIFPNLPTSAPLAPIDVRHQ